MPLHRLFPHEKYEKKILSLSLKSLDGLKEMCGLFERYILNFLEGKKLSRALSHEIYHLEGKLDDLEMEIADTHYDNLFYPYSFADRTKLERDIDKIANLIEDIVKKIEYEGLKPVRGFKTEIKRMLEIDTRIVDKTIEISRNFYKYENVDYPFDEKFEDVVTLEHEMDELQLEILQKLSKRASTTYNMLLFREFVRQMDDIADLCRNEIEDLMIIHKKIY